MKVLLVPLDGGNPIELQKDLSLVGRQVSCDLCIDHRTVSKVHCMLAKAEDCLRLRDLGSTNGCRVNGQRTMQAVLFPNDVLSIASMKFRVVMGSEDDSVRALANDFMKTECIDGAELRELLSDSSVGPARHAEVP